MKSQRLISVLLLTAVTAAAAIPDLAQAQPRGGQARETPYSTMFLVNVRQGLNVNNAFSPDPVPLNKRLVIEFISAIVSAPAGDKVSLHLSDSVAGAGRNYWIPLTLTDPGGVTEHYRATQLVKMYHDGDGVNGPGAFCGRYYNSLGPVTCSITLTGYLVDK